jgi:transketolase
MAPSPASSRDPAGIGSSAVARDIDQLCIDTIRTLSIDAIQKASSGHPGTPMALAPLAYTLWQRFLRFDPADPIWPNRDRFVLSAGHASMLLYSLLFLAEVQAVDPDYEVVGKPSVSLADIERFRQLDSRAPGHPEYRWTSGVETTTGPLGQGVATSVGMAIASKWQGARHGAELFDFDVYAIAGDGCLMEGVSGEAASLAGHLKLDNLCWLYDNNQITIDGKTVLAYEDDVAARFHGYGWNVTKVGDANDTELIAAALEEFRGEEGRPTLVVVDSHIGWGSPHKHDTAAAHGEPLGEEEVRETKRFYEWPEDARFLVPDGVKQRFADRVGRRGAELRAEWEGRLAEYARQSPGLAAEIEAMQRRELPEGWDAGIPSFEPGGKGIATRKASNQVENAVAARLPWLLAGSADLTDSTSVRLSVDGAADFEPGGYDGRQLHYGIREHEAAAISNGLSLSKLRPLWSTYLTFSDYARPAIRLSALMELPVIHLFTHDSIGLGEDGPTHQPVEQLASLRAIPGLDVIRPADANEVAEAWRVALDRRHQPVALVLTRQGVPVLDRARYASAEGLRRGGYVLADPVDGDPELILIATGSDVALAIGAHEELSAEGVRSRVVSLPCWEIFDRQDQAYRDQVLPPQVTRRVSVEEASTLGWDRYVGYEGVKIGMHTFGTSAPLKDVQDKFGFTPDRVAEAAKELL